MSLKTVRFSEVGETKLMITFDIVAHYQLGFYAPNSVVEPSPDIIGKLIEVFKGTGFMPNLVSAFHISSQTPETRDMLTLVTNKSEWVIEFEPHRISFTKKYIPDLEIGSPDEFKTSVVDFCSRILSVIPLSGGRLSYVTKGLLEEMSQGELDKVNSTLMNVPAFYRDNPPQEWTTRNVARYTSKELNEPPERYNVITDINRVQANLKDKMNRSKNIDRIEVGYDINTYQKNMSPRFGINDVEKFLNEVTILSGQITSNIAETIKLDEVVK